MSKITPQAEQMLRNTAAMHKGCLEEINKLLIAGGCEPEPETIINGAKVVASGVIARTGSFFSNIGQNVKDAYETTKKAGEIRIQSKEIDRQVEDQMKAVKEKLHKACGA
jgi:hypothetical protein